MNEDIDADIDDGVCVFSSVQHSITGVFGNLAKHSGWDFVICFLDSPYANYCKYNVSSWPNRYKLVYELCLQ